MLDVLGGAESVAMEKVEAERSRTERQLASMVRKRMARPELVDIPGLEFGVSVETVEGGKAGFCDALVLPGAALGVIMAEMDVASAEAIVDMVRLQAQLRARFYAYGEDLREMLDSVERAMRANDTPEHPVRLLLGRYDARSRRFIYINAGYEPPILIKNRSDGSETRRLVATGRPLAAGGAADWKVEEVEVRRRDLLVLVSPGLIAGTPTRDKWGERQLMETLLDIEREPANAIAVELLRRANTEDPEAMPESERSAIVLRPAEAAVRPISVAAVQYPTCAG